MHSSKENFTAALAGCKDHCWLSLQWNCLNNQQYDCPTHPLHGHVDSRGRVDAEDAVMASADCGEAYFDPHPLHSGLSLVIDARNSGKRCISFNHKTGTMLARCLSRVADMHNVSVKTVDHSTSGCGTHAQSVNMVRDPFTMVDSGYNYHRSLRPDTTNMAEAWAFVRPPINENQRFLYADAGAAFAAFQHWQQNCTTAAALPAPGQRPASYVQALLKLDLW